MAAKDNDGGNLGNTEKNPTTQNKPQTQKGGKEKSQLMIPGRIPVQETEYFIFLPPASVQGF